MGAGPKCFIRIESEDQLVKKLQTQIEKSFLLGMWLGKAVGLLDRYCETLDQLDTEADSIQRGILIESLEARFMASVLLFHRCFSDQPSMHLEIDKITNDERLTRVFRDVETLRHDEFIHWKGIRSEISVRYSFEAVSAKQCNFAEELQGHYSESIGPGIDAAPLRELYSVCIKYVEQKRNEILEKLRKHLATPEIFLKSQFLNESGQSVIRKI
jgi:hypothetical protein